MIKGKRIVAVITARKGSKRLPGKNMIDLYSKPLISWTIEEALKSKYIDDITISTDDENIITLAKKYERIKIPFTRPSRLSSDGSTSLDVILHTLDFYKSNLIEYDYVMLLQPTSPLRLSIDIDNSIEELSEDIKSVISVCETDHSPLWCNTLPNDKSMKDFLPKDIQNLRSQSLPKFYRLNGAVYIAEVNYLIQQNGFLGDKTKAYIMPIERSIDIDSKIDLDFCKIIMKENINK